MASPPCDSMMRGPLGVPPLAPCSRCAPSPPRRGTRSPTGSAAAATRSRRSRFRSRPYPDPTTLGGDAGAGRGRGSLPSSGCSNAPSSLGDRGVTEGCLPQTRKPGLSHLPFPRDWSPRQPLGCCRVRSPARACFPTHADRCARLRQTLLLPVHPLCSIRRSQRPWCEPPKPAAWPDGSMPKDQRRPLPPPGCLRVRLRIPPSLSWRYIAACRSTRPEGNAPRRRGSRVSMHRLARGQPIPSICSRNPERPVAARRESPF
jgi:hypothetical protein